VIRVCETGVSVCGADGGPYFVGCDTTSTGKQLPTFWFRVLPLSVTGGCLSPRHGASSGTASNMEGSCEYVE
jgi:hypothetical protein